MTTSPSRGGSYIRDAEGKLKMVEAPTRPIGSLGASAKPQETDAVIEALKERMKVDTDQALAEALSIGRSTIANWRRRGRVPQRYMRLVDEDAQKRLSAAFNFDLLSEEERAALCLAIMRMQQEFLSELQSYPEFLRLGAFIPKQIRAHMDMALCDLLAEMEREGYQDARQCLNAMVFSEFFSG